MATDADFNLYDDLDDAFVQPLEKDIEKKRAEEQEKLEALKNLEEKLKESEKKITEILASKSQIEKNMSILSLTAKGEIER